MANSDGEDLRIKNALSSMKPIIASCNYVAEFERMAKNNSDK